MDHFPFKKEANPTIQMANNQAMYITPAWLGLAV